jgi:hypothetical protein
MEDEAIEVGERTELEILVEQLDQMIAEGADDWDDAVEIAAVAGQIARMDPRHPSLVDAAAWRERVGAEMLAEAFAELDTDAVMEELDGALGGADEEVEDALYEVDDLISAAIWAGHRKAVRELAKRAAATIRQVPDSFSPFAGEAARLARLPAVAADLDLYDFWLAVADAGQFS